MNLFCKDIPNPYLFELLDEIALKIDKPIPHYVVNISSYKKFLYENKHLQFIEKIRPYYNENKRYYLDRTMEYNAFTNIIRQICKNNSIPFKSKIAYNKSEYNIHFYIYYAGLEKDKTITDTATSEAVIIS